MQPALISIVVPAYNAERFIDTSIGSILAQLLPHHALIVIDDGSTDATPAMLERLRAAHPGANFSVIRQANGGISAARNAGLAAADGEYVMFVDADDVLRPGSMAALDAAITSFHPDAISCDFMMWRPDRPRKNRRVSLSYPLNVAITEREAILRAFFNDRHTYVWAYLIRRSVYLRQPVPVFPLDRSFEDVSLLAQLLHCCDSLVHLPHVLIDYRQHPSSITKVISEKWCVDFVSAMLQVATYFRSQSVGAPLRLQIDVATSYFYVGVVKCSYQLPWARGRQARAHAKQIFLDSLFNEPHDVLAALRGGVALSHSRRRDATVARKLQRALDGSLIFDLTQIAGGRFKLWRRMRAAAK
jgi:hypothetical protein